MLFVFLAVMTVVVLTVVVAPLFASARAAPDRAAFDRAVYRDQLKELERDCARGLIGGSDAALARLEIERRLLATDQTDAASVPPSTRPRPLVAVVLALLVAGGAAAIYLARGSPGVPDMPYAERGPERALVAAHGETDLTATAAALAKRLAATPNDAEGWLLYARTTAALQQWQKAADAYHHALQLTHDRPDVAAAYGEMLVMAADGIVTPAAHDAFAAALAKDPQDTPARYYLALGDAQAGRVKTAIAAWQKLAADAPADAPIRVALKQRIAEAAASVGMTPPPLAPPAAAAPGPSAAEMAAAAKLSPAARSAMIRSMVEKLAADLKAAPDNLSGWLRLARAYAVLGEKEKAVDAYDEAGRLSPDDAEIPLDAAEVLLQGFDIHEPIPARAVALLQRARTLDPDAPTALWYLGLAAAQAHRFDAARADWQRLLTVLPAGSEDAKTVAAALGAIKGK